MGELVGEFAPEEPVGLEVAGKAALTGGPERRFEIWFIDRVCTDHVMATEMFERWVSLDTNPLPTDFKFQKAGAVNASNVEEAWERAQNIDGNWRDGEHYVSVFYSIDSGGRSASTCDIFVDRTNKEVWMATWDGWAKMTMPGW